MKSVVLVPYCPLPADTGGKREMWKHLEVLKELGECRIVSAAGKPVGTGWTPEIRAEIERLGYGVTLREESCAMTAMQLLGIGYAAACKALGFEKAFGHSNPYHRYAFPADWWRKCTEGADLAVINYSYWSSLPCECPKVVVLHDLLSGFMWEGAAREVEDLNAADLVIVISKDEESRLNNLGVTKTFWSPPIVQEMKLADSQELGLIGSANSSNLEGLRWLAGMKADVRVRVYGGLASFAKSPGFIPAGYYESKDIPFRECGVILMPTALGMGVQIKGIEALAAGRAIVARRGAMRGIPPANGAWIEVDTPEEMTAAVCRLQLDPVARSAQMSSALEYYRKYLDAGLLRDELRNKLLAITSAGRRDIQNA